MAIRNAQLGRTDFVNGEVLYDYDLDDTNNAIIDAIADSKTRFYSDNTGGSNLTATETVVATLTIPAGNLGTNASLLISSGIYAVSSGSGNISTATFKLYIGGVAKKTITLYIGDNASVESSGSSFNYLENGVDNTGTVTIEIKSSASGANPAGQYCFGLTTMGIK